MRIISLLIAFCLPVTVLPAGTATRLKDLASIEGVRDNQLVGYGLVVGLNGTGDKRQTVFSAQSLANLLDRMGVQVAPSALLVRNTAAVMITATLPPFAQPGQRLDVSAAAIGDATNLQGGLLIMTPLAAVDGSVFAVAQGSVVTGGFVAGRGAGNSMTVNHPTSGRIPNGALVERPAPSVLESAEVRLQLRRPDFTTAVRAAEAINKKFGAEIAKCENSGLISVAPPEALRNRKVELIAALENVQVEPDLASRVIINERTGTIVLGKEVAIRPVSVMHGSLAVEIQTSFDVSQPAPLSKGQTTVVPEVGVGVKEEKARSLSLRPGATVEDLVKALNAIQATPRDVIAVLQALRAAGALEGELEII